MNHKKPPDAADKGGFEAYRCQLREQLPELLIKVTCEYKEFAASKTSDDVKSFAAHQTACRAALTHLHLLIRIASWAQPLLDKGVPPDDANELDTRKNLAMADGL